MKNNINNFETNSKGLRKIAILAVIVSVIVIVSGVGIMYFSKGQSSGKPSKSNSSDSSKATSGKMWYEKIDMSNKKDNWASWIFYDNITNFPIKSSDVINNFKGNNIYGSINDFMNFNLEPGGSKSFVEKDTGKSGQTDILVEVKNNSESNLSVQQCIDNGWFSLRAEVWNSTNFIPGDVLNIDLPSSDDDEERAREQLDNILTKYGSPSKIILVGGDGKFYEMAYDYDDFVISIILTGEEDIYYYNFVYYYSKDFWKEHEDELKRDSTANSILGSGYKVVAE